ncbi:uncharacterized protein TNCV_1468931 [Trichonephila clavipes]|nr:uncharacterized protein TNCV_1468931 [Trichonephila clavipes]
MNINLPKLHINKYSGNYSEWLDFYNLFESSIHNNNRLSKVDKFNYLKSYLCGNALACINGFPISDDNYDRALDLLKDRFGNKNMLINAHLSNLLNLTPVRNSTDIVGLRNLYDRAETQIRSLESLGVKRRILLKLINTHPVETDTLGTRFGIQSFSKGRRV